MTPSTPPPSPTVLDRLAGICKSVAMAGLVIITLVQAWQVFGRYVLNDSPGWTEPVSVFFMGMTVMLGAAVGVREGTHFAFSNVQEALPIGTRKAVIWVLNLLTLAVAVLLAYWGGGLVLANWDVAMAGAPLPAGVRYLPFTIGALIMAVFAAERLIARTDMKAD